MTPAEVRGVLLEEARWWANQPDPDHSGTAHDWIEVFEQLPDDDRMLVMLCDMYQDTNAFRDRLRDVQIYPFSVWNMICSIYEKLSGSTGRAHPRIYEREVLPRIQEMTVPELMKLTGLSQFHRWKVRKGERRLHARHWAAVSG